MMPQIYEKYLLFDSKTSSFCSIKYRVPCSTRFFIVWIVELVEIVFHTELQFPALVVVVVEAPRLLRCITVGVLTHREVRHAVLHLVNLQELTAERIQHVLLHAPA